MKINHIPLEFCKQNFTYSFDGKLFWKESGRGRIVGKPLGSLKQSGYLELCVCGRAYRVHRILYQLYNDMELTTEQLIDHEDRNRSNNRKENLRIATISENGTNSNVQKNNKSTGIKNIYKFKRRNLEFYRIFMMKNGKRYQHDYRMDRYTLEDVKLIRNNLLKEIHGEFSNEN